jgi:hypothetical protein
VYSANEIHATIFILHTVPRCRSPSFNANNHRAKIKGCRHITAIIQSIHRTLR